MFINKYDHDYGDLKRLDGYYHDEYDEDDEVENDHNNNVHDDNEHDGNEHDPDVECVEDVDHSYNSDNDDHQIVNVKFVKPTLTGMHQPYVKYELLTGVYLTCPLLLLPVFDILILSSSRIRICTTPIAYQCDSDAQTYIMTIN